MGEVLSWKRDLYGQCKALSPPESMSLKAYQRNENKSNVLSVNTKAITHYIYPLDKDLSGE